MSLLLGILVLASFSLLMAYVLKMRTTVRDLKDAVDAERRLLQEGESKRLQSIGFDGLIESVNKLVDRYNCHAVEKTGYTNQVEAILGSVQEASC